MPHIQSTRTQVITTHHNTLCSCQHNTLCSWGEPERAPHVRVVQRARLYIYINIYIYIYISSDLGHGANSCQVQNGQDGRPLLSVACDSNSRFGQLQTRRKSYETKQTLQPLPQARIQASAEGITPTALPPRSRISQDPQRSSLQSLDRQVKRYAKRTRLQRHLPLSICNSAVPPLNFANMLLVLLQSTSTHRALATFIVH